MTDEPKFNSPPDAEPTATRPHAPLWIFSVTLVLFFAGAVYFDHAGGWFNAQVYAPYLNAEQLDTYQPKSGAAQFLAQGKKTYETVCGVCHGVDGLGKPGQFPPLAGSEWVNAQGYKRFAYIPLDGISGLVHVKGQEWNAAMAPMGAALSDNDLAAVLTYIRTSWGNQGEPISPDDVKAARAVVAGHPAINGEAQLMTMPQ